MLPWFVIRTGYQQEQRVSSLLAARRINTFLPLIKTEERLRNGLLVDRLKPLFTRYLFVQSSWKHSVSVRYTKGVEYFVGYVENSGKPAFLTDMEMQELKTRLNFTSELTPVNFSRPKDIHPGMLVQILLGPYRDRIAPVKSVFGSRVEVLFNMLGKEIPCKLDRECLTAVA